MEKVLNLPREVLSYYLIDPQEIGIDIIGTNFHLSGLRFIRFFITNLYSFYTG